MKTEMRMAEKVSIQTEVRKNRHTKKKRKKGTLGKQMERLSC
jgi:hypothetical protein